MPLGYSIEELEQLLAQSAQRTQSGLSAYGMAEEEMEPRPSRADFMRTQTEKQRRQGFNPLFWLLDVLGATGYGVTGFFQGAISAAKGETDISTAFIQMAQGLSVPFQPFFGGVNPAHRYTMADTLKQIGWDPESGAGRFARGALGIALDVAVDPLTYTGFGVARHAMKIGGATLSKAGGKMAHRLRNIIARAEGITDEILANNRLQEVLLPFVSGNKAGRSVDTAKDILQALGKPVTEEGVNKLLERGLLEKYLDRGGIKFMGRTLRRSATADAAGVAWDAALAKYIAQPIGKGLAAMGEAAMKVKPIRGAVEAGRSLRTALADFVGPGFISGYHMKNPSGRAMVRLFERQMSTRMDDINRNIEKMKVVMDDAGKVRSVRPDEARLLSRAFHDADFFSDPRFPDTFDLARAEQVYADVPKHLQPIVEETRNMLKARWAEEAPFHGLNPGRQNYWHQLWKEDSPYATREALKSGRLTPEEFDSFLKARRVHVPWEKAVKAGIEQDFFRVLESRLKAGASLVTTQDFMQHMADQYGAQFVRAGQKVMRKQGREGILLADMLSELEARGLAVDGRPLTQAGKLGEAVSLARDGKREAALDALRKAKPEMPEAEISKAVGDIRAEFKQRLKTNLALQENYRPGEGLYDELVHEAEGIRQHLDELAVLEKKLQARSSQRLLREATRRPQAIPAPAWLAGKETLERAEDEVLRYRQGVLGGRVEALERRAAETTLSEAEVELLRQAKADLARVTYAMERQPEYAKTWAGFRHLSRKAMGRHEAELRALGYTAEEAASHVTDLQAHGALTLAIQQEAKASTKNFKKWATGRLPVDDPAARELVRADLEAMEGLYRKAEGLEGALAAQDEAFQRTIQDIDAAVATRGFMEPEEARSLYLTQIDLQVRREGLSRLKRGLETPEAIRRYRAMLEDPQIGRKALENAAPLNASITPAGDVIRVPLHPAQARAINQVLSARGVGKYTPELFEHMTGVRSLEDLSFQTAQEFLEIARRRPASLREAIQAGVMETVSTEWKRMPAFRSIRVEFQGQSVATRDVLVPANVAQAIQSATTHWRPGPGLSMILGGYDRLQDLLKWSLTMPWPAYWSRNTLENQIKAFTEVGVAGMVKPRYMEEWLHTLFGSTKPVRLELGELPRAAIIEGMMERGLLRQLPAGLSEMGPPTKIVADVLGRLDGVWKGTGKAAEIRSLNGYRMLDILRKPPFNIPNKAIYYGTQLENATIFTFLINRLDQGHTLEAALDAAEDVFFTFTHLTEFERQFMRRVIPFYSWMRQAVGYTGHVLKEHPWLPAALADIGQFGGGEEEYAPYIPEYVKNSLRFKVPSKKGEPPRYVVLNNLLTIDWTREFATEDTSAFVRSVLGSMSPLITAPFEFALKKDFFFGGDIRDRQRISAVFGEGATGDLLRKWLQAREIKVGKSTMLAVNGERLWFTRSFMLSRLYNSLVTWSRKDMVTQDKLLRLGMGLMSMQMDLQRQKDLLRERAFRMQNDFFRAAKQGDTVRAEAILEDLRGK